MLFSRRRTLPSRRLQEELGVTRIARITGLDRIGVEVACAIRPLGHVLQVSNGKGRTFAHAAAAALSEAAELWACERVVVPELKFGSLQEMEDAGHRCVWPDPEVGGEALELVLSWRPVRELSTGAEGWVPAQAVHCPPSGVLIGPQVFRWTSNGVAAHTSRNEAIRHALRELIERDQLARALPNGFTSSALKERRLAAPANFQTPPGFEVAFFDATPKNGLRIPVAAALLFDLDDGPIPLTAGYACADSWAGACQSAFFEAAQSRLTDIHGAREDVVSGAGADVAALRKLVSRAAFRSPKPAPLPDRPRGGATAEEEIAALTSALRRAGYREVFVAELARSPLWVVRVIVRGLRVSELL